MMLDQLREAMETAQAESAAAEIVLLEANAHAAVLRDDVMKLEAAVAALSGDAFPAEPPAAATGGGLQGTQQYMLDGPPIAEQNFEEERVAPPRTITTPDGSPYDDGRSGIGSPAVEGAELTQDQFATEQRRKRTLAKQEEQANNPYANIQCPGCGTAGQLFDSVIQAPSGAVVRMMVCGKCNNQIMQ